MGLEEMRNIAAYPSKDEILNPDWELVGEGVSILATLPGVEHLRETLHNRSAVQDNGIGLTSDVTDSCYFLPRFNQISLVGFYISSYAKCS